MKPYLIIGDLHGNRPLLECILAEYADTYRLVFVGDFVDSFEFSIEDQIWCVRKILGRIQDGEDDIYLWGNHEMSYVFGERCSGWNLAMQSHIDPIESEMRKHLRWFFRIPDTNIFVTHAGLSEPWWDHVSGSAPIDPDNIEKLMNEWAETYKPTSFNHPFKAIGYCRGGYSPFGGPLWCDWNHEFQPIETIRQVFGHTHLPNSAMCTDDMGNWNIDCLGKTNKHAFIVVYPDGMMHLKWGE